MSQKKTFRVDKTAELRYKKYMKNFTIKTFFKQIVYFFFLTPTCHLSRGIEFQNQQ